KSRRGTQSERTRPTFASAKGFTKEAVEIADINGIACWKVTAVDDIEIIGAMHHEDGPLQPANWFERIKQMLRDDVLRIVRDAMGFPGTLHAAIQKLRYRCP